MKNITQLLRRPGVRYLLVGGAVYLFELAVIVVAQTQGLTPVQAVALAFVLGTLISFILQKLVTFGDKRMHHRVVGMQLLAVILLVGVNFSFSLLATAVLQGVLPAIVIRTLALAVTTIWNFYLYKTRIFKGAPELAA